MPITCGGASTLATTCGQVSVTSVGGSPHVPTTRAAMDPPGEAVAENAAPITSVGAAAPHEPNWCKMMSR